MKQDNIECGTNAKCKKCGGPAKCEYLGDLTKGPDYYDTYRHTCQQCGWYEDYTVFAGGSGGTPYSRCPECFK